MARGHDYTPLRRVGKGNMGECILARRNSDGRFCVLKQVSLARMTRREREQALTEARVLWSSTHPNIVGYLDSWVTKDDQLVIAMEYVPEGDLRNYIERQKGRHLKEDRVLDWFIQVCFAVRSLERRCILHRDLKTQNILIGEDGVAKLADFGISKVQRTSTDLCGTFVGTPYYLSPEVVKKEPYGAPSDMWALGVVLAELLTVSHPFTGRDHEELNSNILRGAYTQPPPCYSQGIRELVQRLLNQNPRMRMTSREALASPLVRRRLEQWCTQEGLIPVPYLARLLRRGALSGLVPSAALAAAEARVGPAAPTAPSDSTAATRATPRTEPAPPAAPRPPSAPRSRAPPQRLQPTPPPRDDRISTIARPLLRVPLDGTAGGRGAQSARPAAQHPGE
eukprot:TRINITY_DN11475_c0_g1_i1.p1 TRINITY_DN11475_c0_g1~~TRINITY_DN11475_c0_g1_i1.p1  ORF type:complete len:428 (+),score=154.41 TRINITY_DN11475_c0_g1_i1:100-1284(+)